VPADICPGCRLTFVSTKSHRSELHTEPIPTETIPPEQYPSHNHNHNINLWEQKTNEVICFLSDSCQATHLCQHYTASTPLMTSHCLIIAIKRLSWRDDEYTVTLVHNVILEQATRQVVQMAHQQRHPRSSW